jgi:cytochrome bd-type quinol oxidase subunit 2
MAFVIALLIVLVGLIAAFQLTEGRSEKGKYIVWGIVTMIAFAPFLSFVIGVMYGVVVRNSWATSIIMFLSPLIFVIGLIILLLGIYKNDEKKR